MYVVYLNFAKAFDKVNDGILLVTLRKLGICGKLLSWLKNLLTNRKQCVAVDGMESVECEVLSGFPQGTVLPQLLFLIHIEDIDEDLQVSPFIKHFC